MTRRARSIVFLFVVLVGTLLFTSPSTALAQEPSPISVKAEVGFSGKARVGHWIPVAVQLENQGRDFAGEVHVFWTRAQSVRYVADIVLPRNSRKRLTMYVHSLGASTRLEVELVPDGVVVASLEPRVRIVDDADLFVGVVGQRAGAWNLLATLEMPGQLREVVVVPISPDRLPRHPEVLDAFDLIVLGDVQVQSLSPGVLEAVEGWVAGGGTLVLPGGPNSGVNLKGLPDQLMPVIPGDATELANSSALEKLGQEPLPAAVPLRVTVSQPVSGQVLVQEGEVPLAVLDRYGQGSVLFLAFDPAAQPLVGWAGMSQVWMELLYQSLPPSVLLSDQAFRRDPWRSLPGWANQSQTAISNLPALEFPSINVLLGLIGGYIVLVGPVNYVALRRLRRPGLTWVIIPTLALLFSGIAYFLAVEAKGSAVQGSAVSIIQGAHDTDWARVRRMVGVVAPRQADYLVEVPGSTLVASWDGRRALSGTSYGSSGDPAIEIRNGEEKSELELENMGMWTMRSLWTGGVQRVGEMLSHDLYIEGDRLQGAVMNRSSISWKQVWLIARGSVEDLGALGPGDTAHVDISLVASPVGQPNWRQQLHYSAGSPSGNPREQRLHQQLRDLGTAALESYYNGPPRGMSIPVVAWTDEIPMGITVNEEKPSGRSLTLVVKPMTPTVRGSFSIPRDLVMGRVVNFDGQTAEAEPGEIVLNAGSTTTFQFEVPTNIREIRHMALHVPSIGSPQSAKDVEALAYHWEKDTWDPLDMGSTSPMRGLSDYRRSYPQATPGSGILNLTPYRTTFNEHWAGELGNSTSHTDYVSASGLVRIKMSVRNAEVGAPSLSLQGLALD